MHAAALTGATVATALFFLVPSIALLLGVLLACVRVGFQAVELFDWYVIPLAIAWLGLGVAILMLTKRAHDKKPKKA